MTTPVPTIPYRHHIAVEAPWLLDTLVRSLEAYREHLAMRRSVAEHSGDETMAYTTELCYANAALEQLTRERDLH